jgi:hypothetical protein
MDEYDRVLTNPDNFIISEDLRNRIEGAPEDNRVKASLFLGGMVYECDLTFYSRIEDDVRLALNVGNLDFVNLVKAKNISCEICSEVFEFGKCFEFDNSSDSSILILDTRLVRSRDEKRVL